MSACRRNESSRRIVNYQILLAHNLVVQNSARIRLCSYWNRSWNFIWIWSLSFVESCRGSISLIESGRFWNGRLARDATILSQLFILCGFRLNENGWLWFLILILVSLLSFLFAQNGSLWNQIWRMICKRVISYHSSNFFVLNSILLILNEHPWRRLWIILVIFANLDRLVRFLVKNTASFLSKLSVDVIWTHLGKFIVAWDCRSRLIVLQDCFDRSLLILNSTYANNIMLFI